MHKVVYNQLSITALHQINMNVVYKFTVPTCKQGQYKIVWPKFWESL